MRVLNGEQVRAALVKNDLSGFCSGTSHNKKNPQIPIACNRRNLLMAQDFYTGTVINTAVPTSSECTCQFNDVLDVSMGTRSGGNMHFPPL